MKCDSEIIMAILANIHGLSSDEYYSPHASLPVSLLYISVGNLRSFHSAHFGAYGDYISISYLTAKLQQICC